MIETIAQELRQAREGRALSLEQASRATHIRLYYLEALEAGLFDSLPSVVQARGFVRIYAAYLGLDPEPLLSALDAGGLVVEAAADAPATSENLEPAPLEGSIEAIYQEIGQRLKHQRELLGLSLDDVERHTHLRQHYLLALEAGNLTGLPSPVQGRGMLNNYASFLGMDPEPLLLRFAQGLQAQLAVRQTARPSQPRPHAAQAVNPPGLLRRIFSGELFVVALIVLALAAFITWGAVRIFTLRAQQVPAPTAPSIAEVLLSAPTQTLTPIALPPTPTVPSLPQTTDQAQATAVIAILPGSEQGVQVYVTVRQRTWMRAIVDGEVVFEGRVLPGNAYPYEGAEAVEILTANGAALQIFFNQQDLGPMGLLGQVVHNVYTLDGVQTPTPTITPTPTETPRLSPTPSSTPTAAP